MNSQLLPDPCISCSLVEKKRNTHEGSRVPYNDNLFLYLSSTLQADHPLFLLLVLPCMTHERVRKRTETRDPCILDIGDPGPIRSTVLFPTKEPDASLDIVQRCCRHDLLLDKPQSRPYRWLSTFYQPILWSEHA
jgi:hypothetical protein